MRFCLLFFLVLLGGDIALAQEVLTDFMRDGSLNHVFLHEYGEEQVVLEITPQDQLVLYRIEGDSLTLAWSLRQPGVFDNYGTYTDLKFVDRYVVIDADISVFVYAMEDGTLTEVVNPYSTGRSTVRPRYSDIVDIDFASAGFSEMVTVRVELSSSTVDTLPQTYRVRYLSDHFEIVEYSHDSLDYPAWLVSNRVHGESWTIQHDGNLYNRSFLSDSLLIYQVEDSVMWYDMFDRQIHLLHHDGQDFFRGSTNFDAGSSFAVMRRPTSRDYDSHIFLFDKETRQVTEYKLLEILFPIEHMLVTGRYLVMDYGYVLDLVKDSLIAYESWSTKGPPIVLGDSLLVLIDEMPYVQKIGAHKVVDLDPTAQDWRTGQYPPMALELLEDWLVAYPTALDGGAKLWSIWKEVGIEASFHQSDLLPRSVTGLKEEAQLISAGSSIALLEDDLYAVIEDEVTQLNSSLILKATARDGRICQSQDTIFWAEAKQGGALIKWFAADQSGVYADLAFAVDYDNLTQFAVAEGFVYYQTFPVARDSISIFNTSDGMRRSIALDRSLGVLELLTVDDDVFTVSFDSLCYLDAHGLHSISPITTFGQSLVLSGASILTLGDRQYYPGPDAIYDITEPSSFQPVDQTQDFDFLVPVSEDYALAASLARNSFYLFDGDRLSPPLSTFLSSNQRIPGQLIGDLLMVVEQSGSDYGSAIYDFENSQMVPLPEPVASQVLVQAVVHSGDTLLITSDPSGAAADVVVYRMSDNWQNFEVVETFSYGGDIPFFDYQAYDDDGLMLVGEAIYLVDEDLNFVPLDDVYTDIVDRAIYTADDHFYCIAIDPDTDRQLFRILTESGRRALSTDNPTTQQVSVYPNPTAGLLHVDLAGVGPTTYRVVNSAGREVGSGTTHGTIDLSPYRAGVYTVLLQVRVTSASIRIIKL